MASYLWDASFFMKVGFNMMIRTQNSQPFHNLTIYNYLWNYTDPLLEMGNTFVPSLVPVNDIGMLSRVKKKHKTLNLFTYLNWWWLQIYGDFVDNMTVYLGAKYGHDQFFLIHRYDGTQYLPGFGDQCKDTVINSTEGVTYAQYLKKTTELRYWRKTICRVAPLYYTGTFRNF